MEENKKKEGKEEERPHTHVTLYTKASMVSDRQEGGGRDRYQMG